MKNKNFCKVLFLSIFFVFNQSKAQSYSNEDCNENLIFKKEYFKNIKIVDSSIYKPQGYELKNALLFISKYSHVTWESMLNYARTYPGGIYEEDRKIWLSWYEKNKCKNIQFKKIKKQDIYFVNGIAYDKSTTQLYTGISQEFDRRGNLKFEQYYYEGLLMKNLIYYNIFSQQIVSDEIQFNSKNLKTKHLRFSSDGNDYWETLFDENEKKSEFNAYQNQKLILHKEYLNGKKNGKWFCFKKDGTKCEIEYEIGKKIKDCK